LARVCPGLMGAVTVCLKDSCPVGAARSNASKSATLSANAGVAALSAASPSKATRRPSDAQIESLFFTCRHQNFALTVGAHGTDDPRVFHFFQHPCRPVVTNLEVALYQ